MFYHRRRRDTDCVVGNQPKAGERLIENCACSESDFEWCVKIMLHLGKTLEESYSEFNFIKDDRDKCVPVPGTTPLPDDDSCKNGEDYWYERTPYRKIPYSSCENGDTRHLGTRHVCPGFKSHGALFWMFMILIPFAFTALVAYYYYRRSGLTRG